MTDAPDWARDSYTGKAAAASPPAAKSRLAPAAAEAALPVATPVLSDPNTPSWMVTNDR